MNANQKPVLLKIGPSSREMRAKSALLKMADGSHK